MSGPFINIGNPASKEYFPFADPPVGSMLPASDFPQNKNVPLLFKPLKIRGIEFKNRIFVGPMCQYSAAPGTGIPTSWHLVHLGAIAVRGAALTMAEATAVSPEGRISPEDLGIWSDAQTEAFKPITAFIKAQGSVPAIQLAHAGRKASTLAPWLFGPITQPGVTSGGRHVAQEGPENGWTTIAPSPVRVIPFEMTLDDIETFKKAWGDAVRRSVEAGFEVVEIHSAHGYLSAVFLEECIKAGADLMDVSTGGHWIHQKIKLGPGYQVPWAEKLRASMEGKDKKILISSVGLITSGKQAEDILQTGKADVVGLTSRLPLFELIEYRASVSFTVDCIYDWAQELGVAIKPPMQYERAYSRMLAYQDYR
ncbi:hypothetical protein MNV49_004232 [Pseudohyphozyma bogoriensis]|nr:hypothetical protein MNV49_004232 [Pseudohyphozyma bogoriensis]